MSFTGEYNNSLDQKNRLSVPAKFRKTLKPINDKTFVVCKGFDACLFSYPVEEWKIVEEQLSSLSSIKGVNRNFYLILHDLIADITLSLLASEISTIGNLASDLHKPIFSAANFTGPGLLSQNIAS